MNYQDLQKAQSLENSYYDTTITALKALGHDDLASELRKRQRLISSGIIPVATKNIADSPNQEAISRVLNLIEIVNTQDDTIPSAELYKDYVSFGGKENSPTFSKELGKKLRMIGWSGCIAKKGAARKSHFIGVRLRQLNIIRGNNF